MKKGFFFFFFSSSICRSNSLSFWVKAVEKHTLTQSWIIIQARGNCYYKHSHSVAVLRSAPVQTGHGEAARQKSSRCVPDRALSLLKASATEGEFPWKSLTFTWPYIGIPPLTTTTPPPSFCKDLVAFRGLCGVTLLLFVSGRWSHSSKRLHALGAGWARTEVVRETRLFFFYSVLIVHHPQRPPIRQQWQQRLWKHRSKTGVHAPSSCGGFWPTPPLNVRMGKREEGERNSGRAVICLRWH